MVSPRYPSPAHRNAPTSRCAVGVAWQLLVTGDEVVVGGSGAHTIIHVANGKAWVSAIADGSNRLVDVAAISLASPVSAGSLGRG